jgi:hypothetical protein
MRSLLIIIAFIALMHLSVQAQYYSSGNSPLSSSKIVEQSSVNTVEDSLQLIREKEWNKHLIINSDSRVDTLIQIHREENLRKNGIDGYRIQIYQGTKDEAYQTKARFISLHENTKAYVSFDAPDFKVRVGDFRTRSEAIKLRQLIKDEFTVLYIVEDVINFPDLSVAETGN